MNAKDIISKHTAEFPEAPKLTPNDQSVDGPLLGNGYMTVAIAAEPRTRHDFILCKNDLWCLKHKYGQSCPVPFGRLSIFPNRIGSGSYRTSQDLYTATTTTSVGIMTMRSYVSATNNLLIVEISATDRPLEVRAALVVDEGRGCETQSGRTDGLFWARREFTEGVDIPSGAAAVLTTTGDAVLDWDGSFTVAPNAPVTLMVAMESVFKHQDPLQAAKDIALKATDPADLYSDHTAWWADYWDKSFVSLDDPKIEKQYYLSLYGMGSCSRDPEFPPPIFGWTTTDNPGWAGDYHLNYNHQAPFYGLARANRLEQADPHDAPFLDFLARAAWHCREMYGHDGGIYPVGIGPKGIETTYKPDRFYSMGATVVEHDGLFWGQRSNGAYGLVNMAPRWYCTYDHAYGRRIYPFVLQTVTFWENYLRWEPFDSPQDGKTGRFVIDNDSVHEGSGDDFNNCLSIGLIRNALLLALDLSHELEADADRRETWQHILEHLADYAFQERDGKTVFRYAEKGVDWRNENTLGIQQIYPAGQITLDSATELLEIARNTVDVMQRWHDGNGSNSFFPVAVRVGYCADTIWDELGKYCENARPNGFQTGNPHGIENLSTVPNTVNEMLCMGHQGVIRLFPVWPEGRDAEFRKIRCWGAFLVSAGIESGEIGEVSIVSEKGRPCTVVNPWPDHDVQLQRNGDVAERLTGERLLFETTSGETIILSKG